MREHIYIVGERGVLCVSRCSQVCGTAYIGPGRKPALASGKSHRKGICSECLPSGCDGCLHGKVCDFKYCAISATLLAYRLCMTL